MPKHLEHYELTERIKQLNGATWWRGWDSKLERDVSIWTLPIADPRVLKLKESAAAAANLHDPRVLRVLDLVADENLFGVISEWVHGVTLAEQVIGRAPLKDAEVIVTNLIECLTQAEAQQVIHGALTPDEIVLTQAGIRIRGFGIASVLTESASITPQSDFAAVGAIGYAAVTGYWPLLANCTLPPAPSNAGVVALPSQITPKISAAWDQLAKESIPTINPAADLSRSVAELKDCFTSTKKPKLGSLPNIDLPPSTITRSGLIGALTTIAVLLVAGSVLFFTSLSNNPTTNLPSDNQTGTDLRNEILPVASVSLLADSELSAVADPTNFSVSSGQAIQLKLRERRTVQRIELDISVGGTNLTAQVTSDAITSQSSTGKLGELADAPTTAIVFGPRFITGEYITIWVEIPSGQSVQFSRVAAYGTPS